MTCSFCSAGDYSKNSERSRRPKLQEGAILENNSIDVVLRSVSRKKKTKQLQQQQKTQLQINSNHRPRTFRWINHYSNDNTGCRIPNAPYPLYFWITRGSSITQCQWLSLQLFKLCFWHFIFLSVLLYGVHSNKTSARNWYEFSPWGEIRFCSNLVFDISFR